MSKKDEQELEEKKNIQATETEGTSTTQELLENPEALAEQFNKTEEYVNKNRNILLGVLVVIILGVTGSVFYSNSNAEKEVEAQEAIYTAQYHFDRDSLNLALTGDQSNKGFLSVAKKYDGTQAGNLANYYAGVIYLQKGAFDNAIKFLSKFSSDDILVQPRAHSLIGDANMELKKFSEAVTAYKKAVSVENKEYTPRYLIKLAIAQEHAGDATGARATYDKIISQYSKSNEATLAKKYKGLVVVSSLATK